MGGIMDHHKSMLGLERHQRRQIHRQASKMHRDHRPRALRDRRRHQAYVEIHGHRVDIDQNRPRTDLQDDIAGCGEGHRRGDHLIAGPDPVCDQRQMQSRSAGGDRDCVLNAL